MSGRGCGRPTNVSFSRSGDHSRPVPGACARVDDPDETRDLAGD